jgi:hypothetical protein
MKRVTAALAASKASPASAAVNARSDRRWDVNATVLRSGRPVMGKSALDCDEGRIREYDPLRSIGENQTRARRVYVCAFLMSRVGTVGRVMGKISRT